MFNFGQGHASGVEPIPRRKKGRSCLELIPAPLFYGLSGIWKKDQYLVAGIEDCKTWCTNKLRGAIWIRLSFLITLPTLKEARFLKLPFPCYGFLISRDLFWRRIQYGECIWCGLLEHPATSYFFAQGRKYGSCESYYKVAARIRERSQAGKLGWSTFQGFPKGGNKARFHILNWLKLAHSHYSTMTITLLSLLFSQRRDIH